MRTTVSGATNRTEFREDRRYDTRHTWAKNIGNQRVRVGIDHFAAGLLGYTLSVIFPPRETVLKKGQVLCWLEDEDGPIPIHMPVSGCLIRVNEEARLRPQLITGDSYEKGWLVEVICDRTERQMEMLKDSADIEIQCEEDQHRLSSDLLRMSRTDSSSVGPTMPDGGEPIRNPRRTVGPKKYRKLVMQIL